MKTLRSFLIERLTQLEDRKYMIPKYIDRPGSFIGKKDFSLEDLPKIELDIEETKAAINGIDAWKEHKKQIKLSTLVIDLEKL